ncbi:YggS family pyridoxal phosphate-dependent enzyme [Pseudonocardia humida]|uniref:Pyridoxal phosphate homeostasis protein n=1 Tax=Pseudonocardia humida TaxID=2800819 RepID=A0ABT0ZYT1_9PSEU|nr:YggS family pyridoxal phosphate-dependent enzyme [Pseudonocardia humida]MCO1655898.1 YggS family pyridoxal phosphate-dependent enzyme [Pseudonocardia humida]
MSAPGAGAARAEEFATRLAAVRTRIAEACRAAGRDPAEVELVAVTKTVPAEDVALLLDLGLETFGENRVQEAGAKVERVAELRPAARPRWSLVGGLQRNKAAAAARWADRVESVDSIRVADALDRAVRRLLETGGRAAPLPVLLQFSVDGDPRRGGVPAADLEPLAEHVARCGGLQLRGVMAVAPLGMEQDRAFSAVATAANRVRTRFPQANTLSAGMSGDFESAIRHGSDVVRVGTALVGDRPLASP